MIKILSMIFQEILNNRNQKNEIVFIKLFILSITARRNIVNGTLSVYLA